MLTAPSRVGKEKRTVAEAGLYLTRLSLPALVVLAFSLAAKLVVWREETGHLARPADSVIEAVMGDSRRLFANHFLSKADAYLHSGVYPSIFEQAPAKSHLADAANDDRSGEHISHAQELDADEEHRELPARPRDWIEAFGRNFSPHQHRHADETGKAGEVMPWLRLAADLNPNQIEAYTVGAYWLRSRMGKVREAEAFLREGWRANPNSFEILCELGRLYEENLHQVGRAQSLFELALRAWEKSEAGKTNRDEFALMQITVHLARLEEQAGQAERAILHLEMLRSVSPHPEVIQSRIDALHSQIAAHVDAHVSDRARNDQQN